MPRTCRALALYIEIGDRLGHASAECGLGEVARARGELDGAGGHCARALALCTRIGMGEQAERVCRMLSRLTGTDTPGDT